MSVKNGQQMSLGNLPYFSKIFETGKNFKLNFRLTEYAKSCGSSSLPGDNSYDEQKLKKKKGKGKGKGGKTFVHLFFS